MQRLILLPVCLLFICGVVQAQENTPFTFTELQIPPQDFTPQEWEAKLSANTNGKPIAAAAEWEKKKTVLQEKWCNYLGTFASIRKKGTQYPAPAFEVLETEEFDSFIRKKIIYETEKGQKIRAYLMLPKVITTPRPAVIVFHGTRKYSYHQTAGVFETNERATGYHLVKKGYVTLCPQNCLWYCRDDIELVYVKVTEIFQQRNPDQRGMARMILDAQIAVDLLSSLKEVDASRIGCTGHSLGGKQALYLPAFDERVACSVSSEGGIGIEQSNWEAEWYLGKKAKEKDFPLHHSEILAMVAPRPFLLLGGNSSDGDASWGYINSVLPIYKLYGEPLRVGLFNHKKEHTMPPEAEKITYDFFDYFLKP